MNNPYRALAFAGLQNQAFSFSYAGENGVIRSKVKGIARLMALVDEGFSLSGGFVCDRVVGKAAALLMVSLGAKDVYAALLSRPAFECFEKHGVNILYGTLTPAIINRTKDGICPMEKAVLGIEDPKEAYAVLKRTLEDMRK